MTTAPPLHRTPLRVPRDLGTVLGTDTRTPGGTDAEWSRITGELTRRGFGLGLGALSLTGLLAACGGSRPEETTQTAGIDFAYNGYSARIPADPKRVVVLDPRTGVEFAVMAGYPLIGGYRIEGRNHLSDHLPADFKVLEGHVRAPNAEAILAQRPDLLVVGSDWWKFYQDNKMLTEHIAPVLVVAGGFSPDWRRFTGEQLTLLGRADAATRVLADYDARLASARAEVGPLLAGRKVLIGGADETQFWVQTRSFYVAVARELGMEVMFHDPDRDPAKNMNEFYSPERIDVFAPADLIICKDPDAPATRAETWKRLPAVRAGRVAALNYDTTAGLALTARALLDELVSAAKLLG
ncbi:ABC transporter substrate-binding protein [Streptomyces sp. SID3343]|uniref:ABC transporter substrate-binding protein n=1 Tax=Streptomyces sp. SID3343 TaxID=2690260 RepID=UPI0013694590|nr:ABC transporter substrate-binding protein [Streptomyces sp. SID3343]MYW02537.1 ABC transporter substrate-binding protein [Streptomyces sp. SID3343]